MAWQTYRLPKSEKRYLSWITIQKFGIDDEQFLATRWRERRDQMVITISLDCINCAWQILSNILRYQQPRASFAFLSVFLRKIRGVEYISSTRKSQRFYSKLKFMYIHTYIHTYILYLTWKYA